MAPVFPTNIAIVGNIFKTGTATAIGFCITCGFSGLVLSSPVIGLLAGSDPKGLRTGLMIMPVCAILMLGIYIMLRFRMGRPVSAAAAD